MNFDQLRDVYTDPFKQAWERPLEAKTADAVKLSATVIGPYDPRSNTCPVRLHKTRQFAGISGRELSYPVRTSYQGPTSGSGTAFSLYPGQLVSVVFENGISSGLIGKGVIELGTFTGQDQQAPRTSTWANPETTGGTVTVHARPDGRLGNVEHVDPGSNRHSVKTGAQNVDDWGNQSIIRTGPNQVQSARSAEKAAGYAQKGADQLKGNA